jgi:hypothetical protein
MVDAIADFADDVTITCRTLDRTSERPAVKNESAATTLTNGVDHSPPDGDNPGPRHPQLAYKADGTATHNRYIDVEASPTKLGLTREQLMSRRWPRGSAQHRLKRAASVNGMN